MSTAPTTGIKSAKRRAAIFREAFCNDGDGEAFSRDETVRVAIAMRRCEQQELKQIAAERGLSWLSFVNAVWDLGLAEMAKMVAAQKRVADKAGQHSPQSEAGPPIGAAP